MLEQIDAWLTSNNLTYDAERRDFAFATDGPWDLMHFLDGESLSSHVRPWAAVLTARTGHAHPPSACCTYRRRRAACPQGPTYCTGYAYPPRPYRTYSVLWQPRPALRAILEPRGYRYELANEHLVEGSTHTPNYDDPTPNYDDPTPNYDDASQVRAADLGRRGLRAQDALPTSRTTGKGRARRRTPRTRRQLRCEPHLAVEGRAKHSHRRNQRLMHQRPLSTYLLAYLVRATVQL